MTPADLLKEALIRINKRGSTAVLNADAQSYAFRAGVERFCVDAGPLKGRVTLNLTAGQSQYPRVTLLPRVLRLERVGIQTATGALERPLPFVPFESLRPTWFSDPAAQPRAWSHTGSDLIVWPKSAVTVTNGLSVYGWFWPTLTNPTGPIVYEWTDPVIASTAGVSGDMTINTFTLPFIPEHREALVLGIAIKLAEMDLEDPMMASRLPMLSQLYEVESERASRYATNPTIQGIRIGSGSDTPSFGVAGYDSDGFSYTSRVR